MGKWDNKTCDYCKANYNGTKNIAKQIIGLEKKIKYICCCCDTRRIVLDAVKRGDIDV